MKRLFSMMILVSVFSCVSCFYKKNLNTNDEELINTKEMLNKNLIECLDKYDFVKAEYLLSIGANPNILYKNQSLLGYSSFKNWTDFSIKLIDFGADVNWVDPNDHVSIFSNVIFRNNIVLGKYLLEHNVDLTYLNYSGHNYFEESIFDKHKEDNPFYLDYRFTYLLLNNSKMLEILKKDKNIIYTIIRNWSPEMPHIIKLIYGNEYSFPEDPPVLLISITENEIEALKYFISCGVSIEKDYYYSEIKQKIKPIDLAEIYYNETLYNLGENSIYTKKIKKIYDLLSEK